MPDQPLELEAAQHPAGPPPEFLNELVAKMRSGRDALIIFNAVRQIAHNRALLSSKAMDKVRDLYHEFDTQHPDVTQGNHQ